MFLGPTQARVTVSVVELLFILFGYYAFERMNGVMGSFQTNYHDIRVQLMRRFTAMQHTSFDSWPADVKEH